VLYNNVGISRSGLIADITTTDWRLRADHDTRHRVLRDACGGAPHMVAQGGGSIISMSSGAADRRRVQPRRLCGGEGGS
jgi:NADP-dependent 3-hydroxy acid dehydrogenase YdfG